MQAEVPNSVESGQAYDAEYKTQSLPGTLFRAIGFGLGIASLCVTALTLVLAPVLAWNLTNGFVMGNYSGSVSA
jgi:hypothetical protein